MASGEPIEYMAIKHILAFPWVMTLLEVPQCQG